MKKSFSWLGENSLSAMGLCTRDARPLSQSAKVCRDAKAASRSQNVLSRRIRNAKAVSRCRKTATALTGRICVLVKVIVKEMVSRCS